MLFKASSQFKNYVLRLPETGRDTTSVDVFKNNSYNPVNFKAAWDMEEKRKGELGG